MLVAGLLLLFTVLGISAYFRAVSQGYAHPPSTDFVPSVAIPMMLLAFFAPFSVWKEDSPSRRGYFWSMPLDRGRHTLVKSLNGWSWFMLALVAYLLWIALMAGATGGRFGVVSQTVYVGNRDVVGPAMAANLVPYVRPVPWWQWIMPFTAATIMYLLGSTLVLATDHPWRRIAGIGVGYLLAIALADNAHLPDLQRALQSVTDGRFGLGMVFEGTRGVAQTFTNRAGEMVLRTVERPDFVAWFGATLLWLATASAGVVIAAFRHQER